MAPVCKSLHLLRVAAAAAVALLIVQQVHAKVIPWCPSEFINYNGYCLHLSASSFTHAEAVEYCGNLSVGEGVATLSYPYTNDDLTNWQTAVREALGSTIDLRAPWAGASLQPIVPIFWTWVNGDQVPPAAWAVGQPIGEGGCALILPSTGLLSTGYDHTCPYELSVLCQIESFTYQIPLPDGSIAEVHYVVDENGLRVQESSLLPAAPPHVAELLRKAEEQRAQGIAFN